MAITFKRLYSPLIQAVFDNAALLNSRTYNTEFALVITLADSTILNYATKGITMDSLSKADGTSGSISPVAFDVRISNKPDISHSQSKSPDVGSFELANLDYVISSSIPTTEQPFFGATVVAYLCFPKSSGNYEGLTYFEGLLSDLAGDDEKVDMNVISDLSSKSATVGKPITQRCVNTFGDAWCGVTHIPMGGVCTLEWGDKVSGCLYWGGVFNGAPFVNPNGTYHNPYAPVGDGGPGDTGFGPGGCPDKATSIFPTPDGRHINGFNLKVGDVILDRNCKPVTVTFLESTWAFRRIHARTVFRAGLIVSDTHKFLTSETDEVGQVVDKWNFDKHGLLTNIRGESRVVTPCGNGEVQGVRFKRLTGGWVLRMSVDGSHTYLAGQEPDFYLGNHNKVIVTSNRTPI